MRVDAWLTDTVRRLANASIATARLDSLVLLEDETNRDRAWLLAHPEYALEEPSIAKLDHKITQRVQHIPLAYIRGRSEFYGREFLVTPHTLVPRPETESMIELLKDLKLQAGTRILDVGTGSGCIAITAALELKKDAIVSACDIDANCLGVAAKNAQKLNAKVEFFASNLLEHAGDYDILLVNLPYVPDNFQINTAATHEPRHALFGGNDGLDLYRAMFTQIQERDIKPRYILAESLPPQQEHLTDIAKIVDYTLEQTDDFIQLFKLA